MTRRKSDTGWGFAGRVVLAGGIAMLLLGAACGTSGKKAKILIPEADTAREQYAVADRQEREAKGVFDLKVRADELRKAIVAYRKVEERFPTDTKYTPAAAVLVAEIHHDLKEYKQALAQYEHCLNRYAGDDGVRITALMGMGRTYDDLKQPQNAQPYYKMIQDEYSQSTDPKTRQLVEQARMRYRQIRLIGD